MAQFKAAFLERFPPKLQAELARFSSFVDEWDKCLSMSPRLQWPPPGDLRDEFDYFVEVVWQANATKGVLLCQGMVQNLNEANFLSFAVLLRAFYEQVLLLREYWHSRLRGTIASSAEKGNVSLEDLRKLVSELHSSVRRSKVGWESLLAGDFADISSRGVRVEDQVRLKETAKCWASEGMIFGGFDPVSLYTVLCDLAHPNVGSMLIVMREDGFGFATGSMQSVGVRIFVLLFPSLAAVCMEFQHLQNLLLSLKFNQT